MEYFKVQATKTADVINDQDSGRKKKKVFARRTNKEKIKRDEQRDKQKERELFIC